MGWHDSPGASPCRGTDLAPLPTDVQVRRQRRQLVLVEPFRVHAAVALDAWIEHHPYPERDIEILCRVAVHEYSVRHPHAKATDTLQLVPRDSPFRAGSWDAYCVFCGAILHQRIKSDEWRAPYAKVRALARTSHPVECALKHLAFGLQPAQPDVRRLPDEYVAEAAS